MESSAHDGNDAVASVKRRTSTLFSLDFGAFGEQRLVAGTKLQSIMGEPTGVNDHTPCGCGDTVGKTPHLPEAYPSLYS